MWDRDFNEIESNVCFYSLHNYRILQAKMRATGKSNLRNQRRNLSSRSTLSLQAATFNCMRRTRGGGQRVRTPLNNHKNIGFLSNTGLDLLKNHKLSSQHSMLGQHRHASDFSGGQKLA